MFLLVCSYVVSGSTGLSQQFGNCSLCSLPYNVCEVCVKQCHAERHDHPVAASTQNLEKEEYNCLCGARGPGFCRSLGKQDLQLSTTVAAVIMKVLKREVLAFS